jgi:PKD repeat protein
MKKNLLLRLVILALTLPTMLFGQVNDSNWVDMMSDPNANFYDVQTAFNNFWAGKTIEKGKGYKQFKRWEEHMEPRVYPSGNMTLPSQSYSNYLTWLSQNPISLSLIPNDWSPLGPTGAPAGGGAGRINFVRFDPTNSNTIYVGAPDGGLWKSINGGTTWTTNTDQLTVIGCTDIAINPSNTQIMYLATGDGEAGDSYSVGVLKSIDGGATWNTTGLNWAVSLGRRISRLLMHPSNPLILIAATTNGMYRTIDGGVTWTQTSTGSYKSAEFSPGSANTVYAAGTILRRSIDNGVTWTTITSGLPTTGVQRISIAVTPANSAYVYLLIGQSSDQGLLGIYRSTDSGATFTTQKGPTSPNLLGWSSAGTDSGGQAFYDLAIAVSPTAANTVLVGGVNTWRSLDGGVTWTLNSHWTGSGAPYVHADCHAIQFLPGSSTTYFMGHDGGISKTTNSGTSFTDISSNLQIAQQYRIGLSATTAGRIIAGHQDNGTNLLNGGSWTRVYGGDGMDCFIDRTNNNILYGSYVYGDYYKSTNGGATWTTITTGLPNGAGNASWLSPWHQDPVSATTLYAAGRAALYKSTNGGSNWSAVGTPSGSNRVLEFAIAPSNNQILYAVKQNAISISINGGTTFTDVTGTLPVGTASITNVTISSTNPSIVWVTFSGYSAANKVYKSINSGTTWVNISTGLPNVPCNTIVYQGGTTNDVVYVGTDIGVFYIDNIMSSWQNYMSGLPRVSISDLEIFYPTSKIRAGTYGRGTWESDVAVVSNFAPVADFIAPQTVCLGNTVPFTDASSYTPTTWSWSFPGGTPSTSTAQNPIITYSTAGNYNVTLTVTNVNGTDSEVKTGYITVVAGSGAALPLVEGFTSTTFPPTNWSIINTNSSSTWVRSASTGTAPTAGNSMVFDNYNLNDSDDDEIHLKSVNLTGLTSAQLAFDVAYAPYDPFNYDGLEVIVSTNCGGAFTTVYSKSYTVLATAPATTGAFTPSTTQWRNDVVDLTPFIGQSNVIVAFRNLGGYGNYLYVDNINLTGTTVPTNPTASFTGTPTTICNGQSVTFVNNSAGSPTSYSWTFAGGTPATSTATNPTVTYATAGTYTVSLTATNSSGSNTSTLTNYIGVNQTPATPTISTGGPTTFCTGGSVVLTSSSATGNLWSNGATTQSITVSTSGTYTVAVTSSGCTSSASLGTSVTVNPIPTAPTISAGGSTTFCSGGSVVLTASSTTGNLWSTGATTQSITVSTAGTYTVSKTTAGCTSSLSSGTSVTVNPIPSTPTITAGGSTTFCSGGSVVLASSSSTGNLWSNGATSQSISVSATGTYTVAVTNSGCSSASSSGTTVTVNSIPSTPTITAGGSTSFCTGGSVVLTSSSSTGNLWSTGASTQSITVSAAGTYTVGVTQSGCSSATSAGTSVTINSIPATPTISAGGSTTFCAGGSVVLTSSSASGNLWSTGATTQSITVSTSGTYSVAVTQTGCSSASSAGTAVTVNPAPSAPTITAGSSTSFCAGGSVVLTSSSSTGNLWSTGATTQSITVSTAGTYTVSATTGGCSSIASSGSVINVNPVPAIAIGTISNPITCGTATGSIQVTGTGAGTLNWSGTGTGTASGSLPISISNISAGSYSISFTSAAGCLSNPISQGLNDPTPPATPSIVASGPTTFCSGGSVTLTSSALAGNTWSNSSTTTSINATASGSYSVTYTNAAGCSATSVPMIVIVNDNPATPNVSAGGLTTFCEGNSVVLTSSSTTGNTWTNNQTTPSITVLTSGNYGVTYTDFNGCSSSSTLTSVTVNPNPVVTFGTLADICIYNPAITLTQGGPTGGVYSGNGISGNQFDPNSAGLGTNTLTYNFTDGNGCSNSATSIILVDGCLSLNENTQSSIQIFPNPSTGILTINSEDMPISNLTVFDYAGRKVAEQLGVSTTSLTLDLTKMADGMYTIEVITSGATKRLPIIIRH